MENDVSFLFLVLRVFVFVLSILGVGFFSGAETAFLAADRWAVERLSKEGEKKARSLMALFQDSKNTISAALIGTNVFTALASVMAASMAFELGLGGTLGIAAVSLVTTAVVFIFAELVPKTYASSRPTEMALSVSRSLGFATRFLKPVSRVLGFLPSLLVSWIVRDRRGEPEGSDKPVRIVLDMAEEDGFVRPEETDVIYGVLDSRSKKVADIMLPLRNAVTFAPGTNLATCMRVFREYRYSRIPVLSESGGEVIGVVYIKDVVREIFYAPDGWSRPVTSVMRKPFYLSSQESVLDALSRLKKERTHLAVVLQGNVPVGIVTLEDLLEEILGDIPEDSRTNLASSLRKSNQPQILNEMVSGSST
ncbi:MAG TPA: DUF21 domain-containing protein [Firmicutes bacterium]|nr:DUF21 domain-containing protein [Candidatus Fermentithermobacillaceae bacterium]